VKYLALNYYYCQTIVGPTIVGDSSSSRCLLHFHGATPCRFEFESNDDLFRIAEKMDQLLIYKVSKSSCYCDKDERIELIVEHNISYIHQRKNMCLLCSIFVQEVIIRRASLIVSFVIQFNATIDITGIDAQRGLLYCVQDELFCSCSIMGHLFLV
jgi:hypothetical protein